MVRWSTLTFSFASWSRSLSYLISSSWCPFTQWNAIGRWSLLRHSCWWSLSLILMFDVWSLTPARWKQLLAFKLLCHIGIERQVFPKWIIVVPFFTVSNLLRVSNLLEHWVKVSKLLLQAKNFFSLTSQLVDFLFSRSVISEWFS